MPQQGSRVKACNRCRHLKARCDRERRHPHGCSRCLERRLPCIYDSRPENGQQTASSNIHVTSVSTARQHDQQTGDDRVISLNDEALTPEEVRLAFERFFADMHPHLPFLDVLEPRECLALSPVLFWSIVTVASKAVDRARFERLQRPLRALVADTAVAGRQGLPECQALCLLCAWPLDGVEGRGGDNTQLYARLAYAIATDCGLHRPGHPHEYSHGVAARSRYGDGRSRRRTWCAVYLVDHHVSSRSGLPSTVREDYSLRRMVSDLGSPLAKECRLVMLRNRYLDAICFNGNSDSGLCAPQERITLLTLFKADVDSYLADLPVRSVVSLLLGHFTVLVIGGLCLAHDIPKDLDVEVLPLVCAGLDSAMAIPDLMSPLRWETLPVHVLRCLVYACIYMIQVKRSHFRLPRAEAECSAFTERVLSILLPLSFGNDYPARSRTVLKLYEEQEGAAVTCQSRMGANVYWDLLLANQGTHSWTVDRGQIWSEITDMISRH